MAPTLGRVAAWSVAIAVCAGVYLSGTACSDDHAPPAPSVSTYAAPTTSSAPSTRGIEQWAGSGVMSVGTTPRGGALAAIPPGRYRLEMGDRSRGRVGLTRCSALPCSPTQNVIDAAIGVDPAFTTVLDIAPTDVAVFLDNATLTPVG